MVVNYRAFHTDGPAPIVDLVYALGQLLADPVTDNLLQLAWKLLQPAAQGGHPNELARLIGLGLQIKALANRTPRGAHPRNSTLWDELLDAFGQIAHTPGILEDLIRAFEQPPTAALQQTFAAYTEYRDVLTYDPNDLNGPAFNLTTHSVLPLRDSGRIAPSPTPATTAARCRSFMQLLHDANGLDACTKAARSRTCTWTASA